MPADREKMELYKIIERKEKLLVGYRMIQCDSGTIPQNTTSFSWRLSVKSSPEVPRFIIVGFQINESGDQNENPSVFINVSVNNIYATLNSMRYLIADYNVSFPETKFSRVMQLCLEISFIIWMIWYQTQILPPQIIEASFLYFVRRFQTK